MKTVWLYNDLAAYLGIDEQLGCLGRILAYHSLDDVEQQVIREELAWILYEFQQPVLHHLLFDTCLREVVQNVVEEPYGKD